MRFVLILAVLCGGQASAWAALPASADRVFNVAQGLAAGSNQQVQHLQGFAGEFRILGRKDYRSDREAQFSPVDFAVSEGVLASRAYYPLIGVRQDNRYLTWTMKSLPLPPQKAMQLVSNIHIIPANPAIAAQLARVSADDLVQLQGDLVQINDHGWIWRSSLSRVDVGDGACEILRVQSIKWVEKSRA
ncbi:MAG: hypothetical protein EOP50_12935 [Sphingobacteriales bacterium]|nr:MAG: hypothetical protein EOP50_12935 [Sphingobacteriales bacterium]